jgi:putative transposase
MARSTMETLRIWGMFPRMSRRLRPNCPGMPFHLTARVHGREALFRGVEPTIIRLILETARMSDATVLAYAIMPNHLHIVLVQGTKQLRDFMQPLLRRVALLVQRRHQREGHVFERRYNAAACRDPEYLRNAIVYVHLNPVRAGLCDDPARYAWSSHREYIVASTSHALAASPLIHGALRLFSRASACTVPESCRDYSAFLAWRILMDHHVESGGCLLGAPAPARPCTDGGDRHWLDVYGAPSGDEFHERRASCDAALGGCALELRDLAVGTLARVAPHLDLDQLRSGARTRPLVKVRRQVIACALNAGHRPIQIARFLGISSSAVSLVTRSRSPAGPG